jgi:hypothetical protein
LRVSTESSIDSPHAVLLPLLFETVGWKWKTINSHSFISLQKVCEMAPKG